MAQQLATTETLEHPGATTAHEAAFQAIRSAYLMVTDRFEEELSAADLPDLGFFGVLSALDQATGPSRPRDLLCKVSVTKSGLTRLLDRIEKAGLVERTYCPSDRRGTFLVITDEGREVLAQMLPIRERIFAENFNAFVSETDAETIAQVLEQVSLGIRESLGAECSEGLS